MSQIQCKKCVLDTTVSDISFNEEGICNYCVSFEELCKKTIYRSPNLLNAEFNRLIKLVKDEGQHNKYDCLLGVSGGVDSSYLALIAKQQGLKPLVVHFDNGWNSELAVKNIEHIVTKLGFDLHTFVMDWEEFKNVQLSYLRSSVVDIEVPTDHFIFGALYRIAAKYNIKYILSGANISTEGINPHPWIYSPKTDLTNLKTIHKKFGNGKISKLPILGRYQKYFFEKVFKIQTVDLLNYIPYRKAEVKNILINDLGWKDYGGKHYESVFTRFYQGFILPVKFNIDKRKAHLSNLICTNQLSREKALEELMEPPYPLKEQMEDKEFVLKKFDMSEQEFDKIIASPILDQRSLGSDYEQKNEFKFKIVKLFLYLPLLLFGSIIRFYYSKIINNA